MALKVWFFKSKPSHLNIYFLLSGFSPLSYLFTIASVRIPVHTRAPKCGADPIRSVMLHFRDPRSAASLRYRNRIEITVLVCAKRSPIRYGFRAGAKAIRYSVNTALVDYSQFPIKQIIGLGEIYRDDHEVFGYEFSRSNRIASGENIQGKKLTHSVIF